MNAESFNTFVREHLYRNESGKYCVLNDDRQEIGRFRRLGQAHKRLHSMWLTRGKK
ncbi:hypothetical protein QMM96_22410 [Citrobacter freundii]|uniref:hypothetical protein n=1 Tax=Citrobacter freundii TaxID=546 RepID=UPI002B243A55|nr:hypothetical protein [Citrobacter freundii]MEB2478186.1 hypothetical protein [Citrobacter freundii]